MNTFEHLSRASAEEQRRRLPGDELVPHPKWSITHAITIDAPPEAVWPWIVQLGSGRAGWYAYDRIDNVGVPSTRRIVPELQHVVVGDVLPALPGSRDAFIVSEVVPGRALVLAVPLQSNEGASAAAPDPPDAVPRVSWALFLDPLDGDRTRLIARGRISEDWLAPQRAGSVSSGKPELFIERVYGLMAKMPWSLLIPIAGFAHYLMETHMLRGIKRRAEAPIRTSGVVRPLPLKERISTRVEHEVDTRSVGLAAGLIRLTKGRLARLWHRQVLLLTTRGRKSGLERTVPLQFFADGENMIVVAANSGLPSPPGWYFNLTADPRARVEVGDRTVQVHAEELSAEEAAAFWPRVLQIAPDYAKYPRRTSRRIPLIRLVPATPTGLVRASRPAAGVSQNAGRKPTEIAPDVYWLRTGRAITESNVYFVGSGSSWALIDTAWPWSARLIKESAESVFGANARPAAILLTHDHLDHAGSALELARTWGCSVYVHPDELPFVATGDLSTIERCANPLDRWVILPLLRAMPRRRVESILSETGLKDVTRTFDPDSTVPGLADWECIPTPGHMPGHVSFFRESDRVLIAGDALSTVNLNSLRDLVLQKQKLSGPPYITTWNWRVAKDSVAALAKLEPRVIAGGHGIPMTGGSETARHLRAFADRFSRLGTAASE